MFEGHSSEGSDRHGAAFGDWSIKRAEVKLRSYVLPYRREIVLTVLCAAFTIGTSLCLPFIVRQVIDGLTAGTLTHADLAVNLLLYAGLSVLALCFSCQLRKIPLKLSHRAEFALRKDLFDHLTRMDQDFFFFFSS